MAKLFFLSDLSKSGKKNCNPATLSIITGNVVMFKYCQSLFLGFINSPTVIYLKSVGLPLTAFPNMKSSQY